MNRASLSDRLAALRDRDFAWLLGGRLVVNIGNALGTGLLFFFLLYGLDRDPASAEDDLLLLIVIYTVFVVASSIVSGSISDRTGRRVGIVVWSAVVQGLAALFIALVPSFETTMIGAALLGIGYGAYMSVGLALGTDLLPHPEDHARDLGFVNVSASLGQLLGPLIGAGLVALVGGFSLMFAVGGVLSIVGGVMTLAIRRRTPRAVSRSECSRVVSARFSSGIEHARPHHRDMVRRAGHHDQLGVLRHLHEEPFIDAQLIELSVDEPQRHVDAVQRREQIED